jgi:hypothetical protein
MDFVADVLASGTRFRTLNVLDMYTREAVAMEVAFSLPADAVTPPMARQAPCLMAEQPSPSEGTAAPAMQLRLRERRAS